MFSLQLDPKVLSRQKALEAREEKRSAQIKRETSGMKKMSSFFTRRWPLGISQQSPGTGFPLVLGLTGAKVLASWETVALDKADNNSEFTQQQSRYNSSGIPETPWLQSILARLIFASKWSIVAKTPDFLR
jgi:hypothetical protein